MKQKLSLLGLSIAVAACATATMSSSSSTSSGMPMGSNGMTPTGDVSLAGAPAMRYPANAPVGSPDPRVGLKPGAEVGEAGEAAWNVRLLSNSPSSEGLRGRGATGSDI